MNLQNLAILYRKELLENVIPFWQKHSVDYDYGGYLTCLDRGGNIFDTDKFIWPQCRQAWMFATLFNNVDRKDEWLEISKHGIDFLEKYGHDNEWNWYFSLTRDGKPLIQPYNIFSDCFATMAFAGYTRASGENKYAEIAVRTFNNIRRRSDNPKGIYSKAFPGNRDLRGFSLPMILCNLSLEIEHLLERNEVEETIDKCIHEVMDVFYDPHTGLIRENVLAGGNFSDSFEGRLLNPGHAIEAMWFILDLSERRSDKALAEKAVKIALDTLEYGWDKEYGGIFYFLDIMGYPPQQLEWDQKLWWVHLEALITLIKGYRLTGNKKCLEWFSRVHDYTWKYFPDPEFGEWFGYLNRRGEVLLPLKGGKWKGCFHLPRALFQVYRTIERVNETK